MSGYVCKMFSADFFPAAESLVPQRGAPVVFPLAKVRWRNIERLADIRGYLSGPSVGWAEV